MTTIHLRTSIHAPIQKVFDLSLDIDFHKQSVSQTQEEAIDGVTSGHIALGQTVTWRGKHFGIWLTHTSMISTLSKPTFFIDKMVRGHFKSFEHEHHFKKNNEQTVMRDVISYTTPYGVLGTLFDLLFLKRHLTRLIRNRNEHLKNHLENT